MKKIIVYILLLSLISCSDDNVENGNGEIEVKEINDSIMSLQAQAEVWLYILCSQDFLGRKTGSLGDSLARAYIIDELRLMGYEPVQQEFYTDSGIRLENLLVTIPGENDSTIVIGAHFDGAKQSTSKLHYPAAEDNASGVVALLSFLRVEKDSKVNTPYTITCCFWDSEEVFEGTAFRGSKFFLKNVKDKGLILMYENLDAIGHEHDLLRICYWDWGTGRLLKAYDKLISNGRFNYKGEPTQSGGFSDFAAFNSAKIPYIAYHDHDVSEPCSHPNHSTEDKPEYISIDRLLKIVENTRDIISSY